MVLATLPKREVYGAVDGLDLPVVTPLANSRRLFWLSDCESLNRLDHGRWGPPKSSSDPTLVTRGYEFVPRAGRRRSR